ncbi:MAG: hypothetical protein WCI41_01120 [bacterium]
MKKIILNQNQTDKLVNELNYFKIPRKFIIDSLNCTAHVYGELKAQSKAKTFTRAKNQFIKAPEGSDKKKAIIRKWIEIAKNESELLDASKFFIPILSGSEKEDYDYLKINRYKTEYILVVRQMAKFIFCDSAIIQNCEEID